MVQDMRLIELKGISKSFDGTEALSDVNLYIRKCEFITLLGPSGCGKTTMLRIIGGFEFPTTGQVMFEGKDITDVPPYKRRVNTVFQKYALFPHLNVRDNIAFGLKIKKMSRGEIDRRVDKMLSLVNLAGYGKRSVDSLSGGQQQRIAIARALVNEPDVLLLDEPLGALDLKLRKEMQLELKSMQQQLGITFIYVTHDQTEAMTLADRIVIMSSTKNEDGSGTIGRVEQVGTPQELYNRPANKFVAGFIGSPAMNFFDVTIKDGHLVSKDGLTIAVTEGQLKMLESKGFKNKNLIFGIRPEDISSSLLVQETYPDATVDAEVVVSELLGSETMLYLKLGQTEFAARVDARDFHEPGEKVSLTFNVAKGHFFDAETEAAIR